MAPPVYRPTQLMNVQPKASGPSTGAGLASRGKPTAPEKKVTLPPEKKVTAPPAKKIPPPPAKKATPAPAKAGAGIGITPGRQAEPEKKGGLVGAPTGKKEPGKAKRRKRRPKPKDNFPGVIFAGESKGKAATGALVARGMSVNNIRNLQRRGPVFTASAPEGKATAIDHIVDDSSDSPYLSFEAMGMGISAGKYAPKPVDPGSRKPLGVEKKPDGFLKQIKSYTAKTRRDHKDASWVGYVGVIDPGKAEVLDYSTPEGAGAMLTGASPGKATERARKAIKLALSDREVLVKPGTTGVPREALAYVAKVQQVTKDYYARKEKKQTSLKALGTFERTRGEIEYYKIQIAEKYSQPGYRFEIPEKFRLTGESKEGDDMSDVESIVFSDDEEEAPEEE